MVFEGAQFLGLDEASSQFRFNFPANVYYDEEQYTTMYKTLSSVSFDYDADKHTLSGCDYGFMSNYGYRLLALEMQVMMQPTFEKYNEVVAAPQNPRIIQFQGAEGSNGWIIFDLPRNNKENSFMDQEKVFFNIYYDDELVTFYPDQYTGLTEEMTDVPVDFADSRYDFQSFGSQHRVVVYDSGITRAGVCAFYQNGDKRLYSDIVWSDGTTTGINKATAGADVKSVKYIDLSGRTVTTPQHGVYVKKTIMSDGTVKTSKVVVK